MITRILQYTCSLLYTIVQLITGNISIRLYKCKKNSIFYRLGLFFQNDLSEKEDKHQFVVVFGGSHNEYGKQLCRELAKMQSVYVINIDSPNDLFFSLSAANYLQIDCTDFGNFEFLNECIDKMGKLISSTPKINQHSTIIVVNNVDTGSERNGGRMGVLDEEHCAFMHTTSSNATNVMLMFSEIITRFENSYFLYLINISNVVGLHPNDYRDHSYAYSCSKAAVIQFHQSLTSEVNQYKRAPFHTIKTLLVLLPFQKQETCMWKKLFSTLDTDKNKRSRKHVDKIIQALASGRRGEFHLTDGFVENIKLNAKYKFKHFNEIHSF